MDPRPSRFTPGQVAQAVAILALLAWRALGVPPSELWRDWLFLLGAYWAAAVVVPPRREWAAVTAGFTVFLMVLYWWGQLPQAHWPPW